VALTGFGTPNGMREYVKSGLAEEFILWDPKDLAYLAYYANARLLQGDIEGNPGETFEAGRLGERTTPKRTGTLLRTPGTQRESVPACRGQSWRGRALPEEVLNRLAVDHQEKPTELV
jgi:ABC-type sugar transport system substrate-binding protein